MKKASQIYSLHSAFTLLELVFVIVVIGILSSIIISSTKTNKLQEAAVQVISHIRYTQHLAIIDDKFDNSDNNWYKNRWQIRFGRSENNSGKHTHNHIAYSIFSDHARDSSGNPNLSELAMDPLNNNKFLSGGFSSTIDTYDPRANIKMNIGITYDIKDVKFGGGCPSNSTRLSFDYLGRPIKGNISNNDKSYRATNLIRKTCTITLVSNSEGNVTIAIEPETGYAHIQ